MVEVAASTWGVTGAQFLWFYGGLCAVAGLWVWSRWRRAMHPRSSGDMTRSPDMYDVAMLNGGPQLAITAAATKLHRDGVLRRGFRRRTLEAVGRVDPRAHPLEHEVFEVVRRQPGMWVAQLHEDLEESEVIASMTSDLASAGLLVDEARASRLRKLWLVGLVVAALGIARIVAGVWNDAPIELPTVMVGAVVLATFLLARRRPIATARGRTVVRGRRQEREDLRHRPKAGESAMAVALFGGAALWIADPDFAGVLSVPREAHAWWSGGTYGAGCGDGSGGGCGGGGGGGCGGGA